MPRSGKKQRRARNSPEKNSPDEEKTPIKRVKYTRNMNEDALAGKEDAIEYKFWDAFPTHYLFTWAMDFDDTPLTIDNQNDREFIIETLAGGKAERPAGKTHLARMGVMQSLHARTYRDYMPGYNEGPDKSIEDDTEEKDGADDDDPPGAEGQPAAQSPPNLVPIPSLHEEAEPQLPPSKNPSVTFPLVFKGQGASSGLPPRNLQSSYSNEKPSVVPRTCLTCASVSFRSPNSVYRCDICHLRGDLPNNHEANIYLKGLAAQSQQPAAAASSSSSGQSATAAADANSSSGLSRLDKEFARLALVGHSFPLFSGPTSGSQLTHTAAIAEVRKALGASATEQPSEQLIDLIRSGKLQSVGHAIPRALSMANDPENEAVASIHLDERGSVFSQSKSTVAPLVSSVDAFANAMFSTILPALIDRPAALVNWMALGRTALELSRRHNWQVAAQYITQLLNERVPERQGFSKVSENCLMTVSYLTAAAPNINRGNQPASTPLHNQVRWCHPWNWGPNGCQTPGCIQEHVCQYRKIANCTGPHRSKDCPSDAKKQAMERRMANPRNNRNGGHGSGSGRDRSTNGKPQ